MKSEKAKNYLAKTVEGIAGLYPGDIGSCDLNLREAKRAVELAEHDARERAVAAYRFACPNFDDGRNLCWATGGVACEMDCENVVNFLKHYDHE